MKKVSVPLSSEEFQGCYELTLLTPAKQAAEVLVLAVRFLLKEVLPAYDAGESVALCAPDGREVVFSWGIPRNQPASTSDEQAEDTSKHKFSSELELSDQEFSNLCEYAPGREEHALPSLVRFAFNAYYTVVFHALQGWKFIRLDRTKRRAISLEAYLVASPATLGNPALTLLGAFKK